MRARLGTLTAAALLTASCGEDSEESAPAAAAHASSHAVAHLLEELGGLGYHEGPHDGVFGQDTREALKELQADGGIEQSGQDFVLSLHSEGSTVVMHGKSRGEPGSGQPGF